ncbi:MAG TPA: hypothetical protein VGM03_10720 [Phycisphaerae bacterium]
MAQTARAYPPPGSGGTGGGTIYFTYASVMNTMNSDGSNKTPLPAGVSGEPSYALHGPASDRWFLHITNGELYAVRGDAALDVQLTDELDGITVLGPSTWARNDPATALVNEADSFVSFVGTDGGGFEAVYRAYVVFDAGGVPALSTAPEAIVLDPDIFDFDWAPNGVQLAFAVNATGNCGTIGCPLIYVYTVGGTSYLLTDGARVAWSPSGSKLAFRTNGFIGDIATINPNGSGRTTIATGHSGQYISLNTPKWSPGSTHLVYYRGGGFGSNVSEVYRTSATGGGTANLTSDLNTSFTNPALPVAWR